MKSEDVSQVVGRFAPSPTGPLHFGSLVAAVGSYCLARQAGGRWLVRIEDLDQPRVVPGAAEEILQTLELLGFCWDGEVLWQSRRLSCYQAALDELAVRGLVFDCACSRKEILASAPHPGEEGPVYPGTCRQGLPPGRVPRAQRLKTGTGTICYHDGVFGAQQQHLATAVGDFVLRRADGIFAYQLAVVVDDAECGVNQVVRGADLLGSTPRQIYLLGCLGLPVPHYLHLPLAIGKDGQKISKRDGTLQLDPALGGRWLVAVLQFLGQDPPLELGAEAPATVLGWGVENFSAEKIPGGAAHPPGDVIV